MSSVIIHPPRASVEPDLVADDIPWGRGGLPVGVVLDDADAAIMHDIAHQAIHELAAVTNDLRRYNVIVPALRAENRALGAENRALRDELRRPRGQPPALDPEQAA